MNRSAAREASQLTWPALLGVLVAGPVVNELIPVVAGTGASAIVDWSFPYVTVKFVLLPAVSIVIVAWVGIQVIRRRHMSRAAVAAGVVGLLYVVALLLWPLPWFF